LAKPAESVRNRQRLREAGNSTFRLPCNAYLEVIYNILLTAMRELRIVKADNNSGLNCHRMVRVPKG
jgi:hypothetical protein